jgi:CheY-like chemotaxis protein
MTHILVVDDEPSVRQSVRALLQRSGFEVTTADGGETGLKELERMTFQLMIVDVFMPHMHGFESIRLFHQRAPKVPLIAISGYAFAERDSLAPDFLSMAIQLGAWRCLRKPFTTAALLFVIKECLQEVAAIDGPHATGLRGPRDS